MSDRYLKNTYIINCMETFLKRNIETRELRILREKEKKPDQTFQDL